VANEEANNNNDEVSTMKSIATKVTLFVSMLIAVNIAILQYNSYTETKTQLEESAMDQAETFGKLQFESTNMLMLNMVMQTENLAKIKTKFESQPHIISAKIIRSDLVKSHNIGGEQDKPLESSSIENDWEAAAMSDGTETKKIITKKDGSRSAIYVAPIKASGEGMRKDGVNCLMCHDYAKVGSIMGVMSVEYDLKHNDAMIFAQAKKAIIISIVCLLVALTILAILIQGMIAKPLNKTISIANKISNGDFRKTDTGAREERSDEIGVLESSIETMRATLEERSNNAERTRKEQAEMIAKLDVGQKQDELVSQYRDDYSEVSSKTKAEIENVNNIASLVSDTADQLQSHSQPISSGASEILDRVSSMSESVASMTDNITDVGTQTKECLNRTEDTAKQAEETGSRMVELATASEEIKDVIGTIVDIAEQTNLLALNASIEAARAGDSGRGFAVVANEVKVLAQETSDATKDIESKVNSINYASAKAGEAVTSIRESVEDVNTRMNNIAESTLRQESEASEIAQGASSAEQSVKEVSTAIDEMIGCINDVSDRSNELTEAADSMKESAQELDDHNTGFLDEIEGIR